MDNNKIKELKQKAKLIREGILDCISVDKKVSRAALCHQQIWWQLYIFTKMRTTPIIHMTQIEIDLFCLPNMLH